MFAPQYYPALLLANWFLASSGSVKANGSMEGGRKEYRGLSLSLSPLWLCFHDCNSLQSQVSPGQPLSLCSHLMPGSPYDGFSCCQAAQLLGYANTISFLHPDNPKERSSFLPWLISELPCHFLFGFSAPPSQCN